ncbi:MAG: VTT domain-containing protein [Candidatus Aenigmarchaeota archaeon]|nr:VTT domain-containing protein [Candidatus Aenigmarchaeota archaeon]
MLGLEFFTHIVNQLGYLGFFLIGVISAATVFVPTPLFLVVFFAAPHYNPIILGIVVGIGSAIGEFTGYGIGFGLERLFEKKSKHKKRLKKQIKNIEKLFDKYHPNLVIFGFAIVPLAPTDALGIFCGAIKYSKKKFFFFMLLGKIIKFTALAIMGFYGMNFIIDYFNISL